MTIGDSLASARRAAGLTQRELAERIGTTQSAIARLEHGGSDPQVQTLLRLADVLNVRFEIVPNHGLSLRQNEVRTPTLSWLREHRDAIEAIASQYGASNVRVFGSVARGDARPESDIDFLVDLASERSFLDLSGLGADLEELLRVPVDVIEIRQPSSPAEQRIVAEAVPL